MVHTDTASFPAAALTQMQKFLHPTGKNHRDKGLWAARGLLNIRRNTKPLPFFHHFRTYNVKLPSAICSQQCQKCQWSVSTLRSSLGYKLVFGKKHISLLLNSRLKTYPMLLLHSDCKTNHPNKGQPEGRGQHLWPLLPPQRAIADSDAGAGCSRWLRRRCWWVRWQSPAGSCRLISELFDRLNSNPQMGSQN